MATREYFLDGKLGRDRDSFKKEIGIGWLTSRLDDRLLEILALPENRAADLSVKIIVRDP